MKTIGYGFIQIPVVTRYHVFCIKRTLAGGVTSTGWQQILGCALRILLLSAWGLKSINYSLPQTAGKLIGIYIEYGVLSTLLGNGIIVLFAQWSNNLYLLYPALVIIPVCFVVDIVVKATCYAALFLTPQITSFGILSLVEVWFRGLSLMYGWIILISYIHYKKKDWKLAEIDVQLAADGSRRYQPTLLKRESSNGKSPFSRNSSLSQRGRRSFLLRHSSKRDSGQTGANCPASGEPSSPRTADKTTQSCDTSDSSKDLESELLLGESATMSLTRSPRPDHAGNVSHWRSRPPDPHHHLAAESNATLSVTRSPPRYKKRGGFVPEVLRTKSVLPERGVKAEPLTTSRLHSQPSQSGSSTGANTIQFSNGDSNASKSDQAYLIPSRQISSTQKVTSAGVPASSALPPSLPSKAPVASKSIRSSLMNMFRKREDEHAYDRTPLSLDQKHVPEPVLV